MLLRSLLVGGQAELRREGDRGCGKQMLEVMAGFEVGHERREVAQPVEASPPHRRSVGLGRLHATDRRGACGNRGWRRRGSDPCKAIMGPTLPAQSPPSPPLQAVGGLSGLNGRLTAPRSNAAYGWSCFGIPSCRRSAKMRYGALGGAAPTTMSGVGGPVR